MKKICHIVNLIDGKADGVFNHLMMIFRNYDRTQFEHFIIFQGGEFVEDKLSSINIRYYVVESLKSKFSLKSFKEIRLIIKDENPAILHTHLIKSYIIAGIINVIYNRRFIFNFHGSFIQNDYNNWIEKLLYLIAHRLIELIHPIDLVLVPSLMSKRILENETGAFKSVETYYNGFEKKQNNCAKDNFVIERITSLKNEGKKLICVIGRLNREKRIDKAINIYKELLAIKPDTCMFIIGDGEKITDLKNVAKQYILKDCIFFTGYLENADEYLKYFDLLLITSDREGMPFIIWEAMGNSTPVVSSNVGGIKEILEIYDCGYVFEKDDLSGAVGKISLLLTDESLRKNLAESGLRIVDEKFNSKNFIRKIEQVYFNLLNR